MLQSQSNWIFTYKEEDEQVDETGLSLSPFITRLLNSRGMLTKEQIEAFLHPTLDQLHDANLFHQIDIAAERVEKAIERGESILVYGDYDADGVTSTTLMVEALREKGAMCDYYIPNRFTEGYGPNESAFREAHRQGFQLIITVDNGIAGVNEVKIANELGIDVIITDHHEVQEELPEALAIIHPKCSPKYPFDELAGVGVAFKFASYLLGYFPKQFLDLVVIGTVADLVPLQDENRVLVKYGLESISNTNRIGLQALKKQCSLTEEITEEDIGFRIGPRLNAVGRLQDANIAVDLLLSEDPGEAEELAEYVQELNTERQKIVTQIAEEAIRSIEQLGPIEQHKVLVVAKEGWNQGVLGIVTSRLVQEYHRPAIVLTIDPKTNSAKGSARSIAQFDLFKHCMTNKSLFTHFGGHAQAAGMTLPLENIDKLRTALNEIAEEILTEDDFKPQLFIDTTIDIKAINMELLTQMNQLAPFGMNNPKPIFHVKGLPAEIRQIGATKNHLKILLEDDGVAVDGIGFGIGELYQRLSQDTPLEAVVELQINEWNGIRKPQLFIKDIAVKEWQLFDFRGVKNWIDKVNIENNAIALSFQGNQIEAIQTVTVTEFEQLASPIEALYLIDLPNNMDQLSKVLKGKEIYRMYTCYQNDESVFFQTLPSREEFKWLYQFILKRKYFDYKVDAPKLAVYKDWKLEKIKWMFQVFHDLGFLTRENGQIVPTKNPEKKDLTESSLYQKMQQQRIIEEQLFYSTYHQLKEWLNDQIESATTNEEELIYGF
ncbi:single-stranded-DNA-specific exonuclease RecJ [Gracilibacillus marinus]|uniref:Single-stranded-DNA-specific exonuclease RecJ n=1 Tax=Gracilibacillus marinus TaxID=630535 RepID=A0ABV8VV43_9BACI